VSKFIPFKKVGQIAPNNLQWTPFALNESLGPESAAIPTADYYVM
jgi:hypothetical protein